MPRSNRLRVATWLLAFATLASCVAADEPPTPVRRPNVVIFFADDMRADSIAALGNPDVRTPHLDALARRGLVFSRAYCMGGNSPAVCRPSRNMLLSGDAFFRFGASPDAKPEPPNLPWSFNEAGYVTYHHGKNGNVAQKIQAQFAVDRYVKNDEAARTDGEPSKETVDDAIRFVKERAAANDGKPFLMYLAPPNPHDPRVADRRWYEGYDVEKLALPANYLPQHTFDDGEMTVRDERLLPWPRTVTAIRQTLLDYYAVITAMDAQFGRLTATLDELGLTDNTLVVFSADQGIAVGSHGLLGKQNLYEHSMRAPLIVAGPGVAPGTTDALVYLLDIYPTLCERAGLPAPEAIDGRSFADVLATTERPGREALLLGYRDVQRAIVTDRWKLLRYPRVDVTQLFDLQQDPEELTNLAGDAAHAETVARLTELLRAEQRRFGDALPLVVASPRPAAWAPPSE